MLPFVDDLRLVDHHCHGLLTRDVDRTEFELMLTEAGTISPLGTTLFDSAIGYAVRRWCAPVLDLFEHAPAEDYLARRAELGAAEVNRRFLLKSRIETYVVDTGYSPEPVLSPTGLAGVVGGSAHEIVRLEQVAEEVVTGGTTAAGFADDLRTRLAGRTEHAVGLKSIAAYRHGLALSGERPTDAEVTKAAELWLSTVDSGAPVRCDDEVMHRFLIWEGIDLRLPIQFHVGYGDSETDLHRGDPLLLTELLRATEPHDVPIMLLHNYPFHRNAGFLAQVFPHVFVDVGLATHNVGNRAGTIISETLELAPFGKFLFSSDAWGLAELYYLGTLLFRRGLSDFLVAGIEDEAWTPKDAEHIAELIGVENARRAYRLDG